MRLKPTPSLLFYPPFPRDLLVNIPMKKPLEPAKQHKWQHLFAALVHRCVSNIRSCSLSRLMPTTQLAQALVIPLLYLAGVTPAMANNPGGFVPLVRTPVTTGTEQFNNRTDIYLDNGLLHVLFAPNGNVDSIKYLAPGGAVRKELVSQSGVNFSNHTAIYYYWYPDSNGDSVFTGATTTATNIDLCFTRTYNPSVHKVAADMELHYMLGRGNSGLYVYLVAKHPPTYPQLDISFIQCLWPTAHDATNFFCENQYVDDNVKYGLYLDGIQQKRNGLQPSFYDNYHTISVAGLPVEVTQYTTGRFAGSINGKYSFTFDFSKLGTWGMASDVNHVGLWVIAGGHEYQNNGPTACEYSGGIGGIVSFEPLIAHYGNSGLTVASGVNWSKIYGPWLFYFNSKGDGATSWEDSKQQALAEQQAWPYAWLNHPLYQPTQRATVTGKLVISDPLRPQANSAGAWIGLAAPDTGRENALNNWQFQSDSYQFWVQAGPDGSFTIPAVLTDSPYGGPATYQLYVYSAGANGSVGESSMGPFTFTPNSTTDLGTITWNIQHQGQSIAWEIGIPDRTAAEFRHGDDYATPGLWLNFSNELSNPLVYTVGTSNWATDWNYVQSGYFVNGTPSNWPWTIQFYLPSLPAAGNATLNIAWAGANSAAIQVFVNDPNRTKSALKDFYPSVTGGANSLVRQGIHDKYGVDHISIPVSKLVVGTNTITLVQRRGSTGAASYVMYDYLDLELP